MKRKMVAMMGVYMCLLTGCGSANQEHTDTTEVVLTENALIPSSTDEAEQMNMYAKVLDELLTDHQLLGDEWEMNKDSDMSENLFAISDVDGDGSKELIIDIETVSGANLYQVVMDYDAQEKELYKEIELYPLITIYNNGIIEEKLSHSGSATEEHKEIAWPYRVYQYNPNTDRYMVIGAMEGIDQAYEQDDFPVETDRDKDGLVFKIFSNEEKENCYDYLEWMETAQSDVVDNEEFLEWVGSYQGHAEELDIDYHKLTKENIRKSTIS